MRAKYRILSATILVLTAVLFLTSGMALAADKCDPTRCKEICKVECKTVDAKACAKKCAEACKGKDAEECAKQCAEACKKDGGKCDKSCDGKACQASCQKAGGKTCPKSGEKGCQKTATKASATGEDCLKAAKGCCAGKKTTTLSGKA